MLAGLLLYPTGQSGAGPGHARPARVTSPFSLHKHTYCSAHHRASVGLGWSLQLPISRAQLRSRGLSCKSLTTENKQGPRADRDNGPAAGWGSPQSYFDLVRRFLLFCA